VEQVASIGLELVLLMKLLVRLVRRQIQAAASSQHHSHQNMCLVALVLGVAQQCRPYHPDRLLVPLDLLSQLVPRLH
jgi:hypothetical protein